MIKMTMNSPSQLERLKRVFRRKLPGIMQVADDELRKLTADTTQQLKQIILEKDRSSFVKRLAALSEGWVNEKKRKGWILHQLAATGVYGNSIFWTGSKGVYTIQVPAGPYPGTSLTYAQLRDYLEYGTETIPARPHWRPAQEYLRKEFKSRMKDAMLNVRRS